MNQPAPPPSEASAAELLKQVSEQTQRLVRQELALARLEIADKARHAGLGAGMLVAAGLVAFFATGTLVAMLVLVLATALDAWLAALVVAVALLALTGLLALLGKGQLKSATPAAPEQAIEGVKADVEEIRSHAHT